MQYRTAIDLLLSRQRSLWLAVTVVLSASLFAQETNSNVSGIVKSESGEVLENATVLIVHEPTKNTYATATNARGYFYFFNVKPGGPYSVTITYTGFQPLQRTNLFLAYAATNFYSYLNGNEFTEFVLKQKIERLDTLILSARKQASPKYGSETNIDNETIRYLPSISRNLQDFVRLVPNAKVNGDGIMSLAGQNNKFNAFFIDGSNNTDMLGLANSGIAGGQTNSPLMSMESIEEIKILQAPYDVQYSNFTGGSINAITKSGSNHFKSSAWYFFRDEQMAGRSPDWVSVPGLQGQYARSKLSPFLNQTAGVDASGAFVKNKLFYFLLAEYQNESQPQPYAFEQYQGNSSEAQLAALTETLKKQYNYDPGSFLESFNKLNAKRIAAKLDWNPGIRNKFTISYRFYNGERTTPQQQNSNKNIRFSNNAYQLPSTIHSGSAEWRRYLKGSANNRLLLTFNSELTERNIVGGSFPQVTIKDGAGVKIIFGSNGSSNQSRFTASNFSVLDVFKLVKNKHAISASLNLDLSKISDLALPGYFGSYIFGKLKDFNSNEYPIQYSRTFAQQGGNEVDPANAAAKYTTARIGTFINDAIQVNKNLELTVGIRLDGNALPLNCDVDTFFNRVALPEMEKYYNLEGATSGRIMKTAWQFSPRFGFNYKVPNARLAFRGGAGIFTGHILNVWGSEIYTTNSAELQLMDATAPQHYGLYFNANPYNQPNFQFLHLNPDSAKGTLALVSHNYKYPSIFRTSLSIDKNFTHNWSVTTEVLFTKDVYENRYTNVNILPHSTVSAPPGSRNVYSSGQTVNKIPLPAGKSYNYIFLLDNNHGNTGYSYAFNAIIIKSITGKLLASVAYSFQNSISLFEPLGNANTTDGQWTQLETINGKNLASQSVSDFDLNHRISAAVTKKFNYGPCSSMITLFYNGQSGAPFSYVYSNSIINDDGLNATYNADLIYIPTSKDLGQMTFVPLSVGTNTYTSEQQKNLLDEFIQDDRYLRRHRGQFAGRNAARLPFTNTVDLRLQQDFRIRLNKNVTTVSIVYDIFNFTNMMNNKWGKTYFVSAADNYPLITFVGFENSNSLTPLYQFNPISGKPWSLQSSTAPGNSARWISQLGIKVNFE